MTFNVLLTGVGGEGVLLTSVIVGRAAVIEGKEVSGTQFHGLAQRGGSIPTFVRFGSKVHSALIPRAQADLILGLEPIEAARACFYAEKDRTNFVVDTYQMKPVYANLLGQAYPSNEKIRKMIEPFAKKVIMVDASNMCCRDLGNPIYGNVMAIGVALSAGMLPLKKASVIRALRDTVPPKTIERNMKAFSMGMEYKG